MTQTESNIKQYLQERISAGTWVNPFTGQLLDHAPVFVFGQDNPAIELARVITDHLDVHLLTGGEWGDLKSSHHSFDFAICHSNGCTALISAVMSGDVSAKHIFAMGTDWTTASLDPSKMRGTDITFFVNGTDPVPKIPGISFQRASENTPGLGFTLYFSDLKDLTRQVGNFVGGKQPDTERYSLVKMDPRPGLSGLKAHDLTDSYLPNVRDWMSRPGETQQQLRTLLKLPTDRPEVPIRSLWTADLPSNPAGKQNLEATLMSDMASDAHRVVIAGQSLAAKQMYDSAVKRLGPQNTLWVQKFGSAADIQSQARTFGADTILGVRTPAPAVVPKMNSTVPKPDPPRDSSASIRPPKLGVPLPPPFCPPSSPSCGGGGAVVGHGGGGGPGGGGATLGLGTSGVGGVMLSGTAKVTDAKGGPPSFGDGQFFSVRRSGGRN